MEILHASHWSPEFWSAAGSMINAIVVMVLAVLNLFYLLAARRAAKAAELQAAAAQKTLEMLTASHELASQDERNAMIRGVETGIQQIRGLHETFSLRQRPTLITLPPEWAMAKRLLSVRHPNTMPLADRVDTILRECANRQQNYNLNIASGRDAVMNAARDEMMARMEAIDEILNEIRAAIS